MTKPKAVPMEKNKIALPDVPDLVFNAYNHTYSYQGYPVLGVSNILSLSKLSMYDYIPPERLVKAQHYGNAVHKTLELHDKLNLNMDTLDINLLPVLNQWIEIKKQNDVFIHAIEAKVFCKPYMFAGTLDRLVYWNDKLAIIDFKTAVADNPLTKLQLAFYQIAVESMIKTKIAIRISIRFIPAKPTPDIKQYMDANDIRVALAMLTVVNFGLKEKILP
jgi:hypothetical protein